MPAALPFDVDTAGLPPLVVRGRRLLPIVQGGMGVGVSAHRLAGTVAALGAVGTIASVDLRRHHPDLHRRDAACGESRGRRGQSHRARSRDRRGARARRRSRHGRRQCHARRVRIRGQRAAGLRQRCRRRRRRRGTSTRPAGPRRRPSGRRADPDPFRCSRRHSGREEVGTQGPAAGCDRDRASSLRRRTPGRSEDRGPRGSAFRFRERAAGRAGILPRRGNRRRRHPADPRRRHQSPCAHPGIARAGRLRRPARHRVRRDRGRRCRYRLQARARGRAPGGHRGIRERGRTARARRAHAVARPSTSNTCRSSPRSRTRSRAARSSSIACSSAGCATATPRSASSASTRNWPRGSPAMCARACSFAAHRHCRSARRSARCAICSPISSRERVRPSRSSRVEFPPREPLINRCTGATPAQMFPNAPGR